MPVARHHPTDRTKKNSEVLSHGLKEISWPEIGRCKPVPMLPGTPHYHELVIDIATKNTEFREAAVDILLTAHSRVLTEVRPNFSDRELLRAVRVARHMSLGSRAWQNVERSILELLLRNNSVRGIPTFPTSRDLNLSGRVLNHLGSYWKTDFRVRVVELDKLAAHFKTREIAQGLQKSLTSTKRGGRPQGEQIVRELMTLEFLRQCGQDRPHRILAARLETHPEHFQRSRIRSAKTLQKHMARWLSHISGKDCPADQKLMGQQLIAWLHVLATDILPHLRRFSSQNFQW
jgi:hypothetical protein